ncbi:MAG: TetR/AcrR family transcriptional regulator [bacterium]|nr:TetR/AcrR family transcriptional regulator [bacterium]
MPTSARKQREIAEREERIVDVALGLLVEQGYIGLTMDKIAAEMEYSKGTIYQHFKSKEDVVAAILSASGEIRAKLFERAATFEGHSRERMGAVGVAAELFYALYPHHEQAENLVRAHSIREKADSKRTEFCAACEFRCFGVATGILRDAVAGGEIEIAPGQTVEQIASGLWSLYVGAFKLRDHGRFLEDEYLSDPLPGLLRNAQMFLDGCGWKPLSTEHDYLASRERALREIFPDEARRAGLA